MNNQRRISHIEAYTTISNKHHLSATYITVTNAAYYETLLEDSEAGETNWTISRHAKVSDRVLLYVCAPVSAIVAVATVTSAPVREDDPASAWFGHWMTDMHRLRMLEEPITRSALMERFPEWGYWKQPRNSIVIPAPYDSLICELLG